MFLFLCILSIIDCISSFVFFFSTSPHCNNFLYPGSLPTPRVGEIQRCTFFDASDYLLFKAVPCLSKWKWDILSPPGPCGQEGRRIHTGGLCRQIWLFFRCKMRINQCLTDLLSSWQCLFCIFLNSLGFYKFAFVSTQLTSKKKFSSVAVKCDKLQIWPLNHEGLQT